MPFNIWTSLLFCILTLFRLQLSSESPATTVAIKEPIRSSGSALTLLNDSLPDSSLISSLQSLQVSQWMPIGQDPQSYKTGIIDIEELNRQVLKKTNGNPPLWMMLDFEDPFTADLAKDLNSPEYKRALQTMLAAIRAMKSRWPQCKWAFYGVPHLPYWVEGKGWATASDDRKKELLNKAAIASVPLIQESDWISVSIYDCYDPKMVVPGSPTSIRGTPESVRMDGRAWRMAQVGLAKLLANDKPVIPNVCPFWVPTGIAPYCRLIHPRAFIEDQIEPAIKAGATGFALWTGIEYRIQIVTLNDAKVAKIKAENNFGVKEWRAAFVKDYLGREPQNWDDDQIRQKLVTKTSQMLRETFFNIRSWERLGTLPTASP